MLEKTHKYTRNFSLHLQEGNIKLQNLQGNLPRMNNLSWKQRYTMKVASPFNACFSSMMTYEYYAFYFFIIPNCSSVQRKSKQIFILPFELLSLSSEAQP